MIFLLLNIDLQKFKIYIIGDEGEKTNIIILIIIIIVSNNNNR